MPRFEGDFLFCWTAMAGSWSKWGWVKSALTQRVATTRVAEELRAKPSIIAHAPDLLVAAALELLKYSKRIRFFGQCGGEFAVFYR